MGSIFNSHFNQGTFIPKHPEKCGNFTGKTQNDKITFRSSWEQIMCNFCDREENVTYWASEPFTIPYFSQLDNKQHRYVIDFEMHTVCRDGSTVKWIVEVKPDAQAEHLDEHGNLIYPKPPKHQTQKTLARWQERCNVVKRNSEKWQAARLWCTQHGYRFKVVTEKDIGIM